METVIAIAACALLAVQAHRNYLMVRNAKKPQAFNVVNVPEINYDALARAMEASWPTVNISNELEHLDYNKLGDAIKKALIESGVALHNAQVPQYIPVPNYPTYQDTQIISEAPTTNIIQVDGVTGKQFPAR